MADYSINRIYRSKKIRVDVSPKARILIERERDRIFEESGYLKPRYEIANEAIIKAYGGKDV
jgi:hypothetical protein